MTITKDPTITLASGPENAYVRAKVEYKLDGYEMDSDKAKELEQKIKKQDLDFEDFLEQMEQIQILCERTIYCDKERSQERLSRIKG